MERFVVFDGDDTLWSTEALYDTARSNARQLVEASGLNGALWEATERERDVKNVARFGMSATRFPTSCVEAFDLVGGKDPKLRAAVVQTASAVFSERAPLMTGAAEILRTLSNSSAVVLLTKGDDEVQRRRIESSGLESFFDKIMIVPEKSAAEFRRTALSVGVPVTHGVSVGNSLRSDILPAVEAGMRAIWIDAHVWEWEKQRSIASDLPREVTVAGSLLEVPAILESSPAWA